MSLHVLGRKCPICGKKGLVIGADDGYSFRPQGWLVKRLGARQIACPHCGALMAALLPESVAKLKEELRASRAEETVTYHAKRSRKKAAPPDENGSGSTGADESGKE
ncbi:MAG TPA: hypothetical protein VEK08_18210 [Planctomycetota bacterium]|nr:hypothetical protein [Planctomycetota bacterium]